MKIITVGNNKGGVGKTTTVSNLGAALAKEGKKVLAIDFDAQANLASGLGFEKDSYDLSIYDIINPKTDPKIEAQDVILKTSCGLDLIPASEKLRSVDQEFAGDINSFHYLQDSLDKLRDFYDYIFIDCPPQIGYLTYSAIIASDEIYVPSSPEFFTLEGLNELQKATNSVNKRFNPDVEITGLIVTMHNNKLILHKAVVEELEKRYGEKVFRTRIRNNVSIPESQSHGETIFEYSPRSIGAVDYGQLCVEVMERSQ